MILIAHIDSLFMHYGGKTRNAFIHIIRFFKRGTMRSLEERGETFLGSSFKQCAGSTLSVP